MPANISVDSGGDAANPSTKHISNGDYIFHPGVYYGGIKLTTRGTVTFLPGTYVMAGGGMYLNPNSSFQAPGVFIYNTSDPDCPNCSDGGYDQMITNSNASFTAGYDSDLFYHGPGSSFVALVE